MTNQSSFAWGTLTVITSDPVVASATIQTWVQWQAIIFIDLTMSTFVPKNDNLVDVEC